MQTMGKRLWNTGEKYSEELTMTIIRRKKQVVENNLAREEHQK